MCYSAQIEADYRKYTRMFGAHMSIREFVQLYWERVEGSRAKIPKAMDAVFADPRDVDERQIKALIDRFNAEETTSLEQELFKQRARLADAERTLQSKTTKAATESKRIATVQRRCFSGSGTRTSTCGCRSSPNASLTRRG